MMPKAEVKERLIRVEQQLEELYLTGQPKDWQLEHEQQALETAMALYERLAEAEQARDELQNLVHNMTQQAVTRLERETTLLAENRLLLAEMRGLELELRPRMSRLADALSHVLDNLAPLTAAEANRVKRLEEVAEAAKEAEKSGWTAIRLGALRTALAALQVNDE